MGGMDLSDGAVLRWIHRTDTSKRIALTVKRPLAPAVRAPGSDDVVFVSLLHDRERDPQMSR